ncbi:hypothetical protein PybrP1_000262 [[Pythium] brassicae (nom. inval.)]|nr:hypothetical protein PybrP1_000262 [[Pythium] brassicae (nom. inval.)]
MSAGDDKGASKTRKSRASKRSADSRPSRSRSPGSTRPSGTRHSVITYSEQDANAMILKANAPPNYNGGFDEIMKQIRAKAFYTEQFQRIQQQTEMGRLLSFSDVAPTHYESNYLTIAQTASVTRVRVCFAIGLVSLAVLYANEFRSGQWDVNADVGRTARDKLTVQVLTFGVILPTFALGILSTFTALGRRHLEAMTMTVFIVVAAVMIAKKPIEKATGPVIPLLLLLIPIFGITRMRFVRSCCIGWGIFVAYFAVMLLARKLYLPFGGAKFDNPTNISYQSINYGISVIGGMVSQYRQELLRRRNFCLQLPFSGTMDSDAVADIQTDKFSKKSLMHLWSQSFRHPEVEECFYRYWYLIDPFPYENPNSGSLHTGVFRTIRFAVYTLLLNQFVLLLQDIKFLQVKPDRFVDSSDFDYALVLRFGITVPLYFSAALFMYFMGKAFYAKWVKEAEDAKNAALTRDSTVVADVAPDAAFAAAAVGPEAVDAHVPESGSQDTARLKLVVDAARIKDKSKDRVLDVLINKGGYVRSTQIFSSLVIATHVACMGILLLIVSTGERSDELKRSGGGEPGKPKPVYYMGFLNAVLFAHRSGFRVRFIYATYTTAVVAVGIILAASSLSPKYYLEYAGYVFVILVMGMMISYEEENLRRTFFVLKSIRTLEFDEWFAVVLRIQGWVKEHIRKKLRDVRSKGSSKEFASTDPLASKKQKKPKPAPPLVNTSAQMAQASKLGMYSQMANIVIALLDVLTN